MELFDNIAKQFLTDTNADGKVDLADAVSSLQTLLSDASGKVDVSAFIAKLQAADLSEAVHSWLGDGENSKLSVDAVSHLFDTEKLNQFAASLNIDLETAKAGLANAIPNLIDQVSDGGELKQKFSEGLSFLQEEAAEVTAAATATAGGLFAKIKQLFS